MIRGLYSAATALDAAAQNQELVADNLANASTPGFRRHGLIFQTLQQSLNDGSDAAIPPSSGVNANLANSTNSSAPPLGASAGGEYTSFESGPLQYTGNPLDVALSEDAFFVLDGPSGPAYTRNGTFRLNSLGQMESASGMPVRSQGGRLTIPQNTSTITVSRDGSVYADNAIVGQLEVAYFPQPNAVLQRIGTTLFGGPRQTPQQSPLTSVQVMQGYREGSNVQIVNEMVSMIAGMRHYEAAERALHALADAVQMNTRPQ